MRIVNKYVVTKVANSESVLLSKEPLDNSAGLVDELVRLSRADRAIKFCRQRAIGYSDIRNKGAS